ncbi:RHTO0S03e01772g1_1 [Rhodotorula toruloides]|uniref:RHTO0S03e01772g1_1 n=2 Tax=Rhodotorula toruloides TaxID=5286 RepID=A0A061ATI2_RHOTO|nr:urea transporter [Rhodotorula toruloides NP11]EMS25685.1 urea transporter [Rhodotorula toruloides NP11]CDR38001.1 RHTO0S03e01772g1_1 [Rhodotorula toruloides]
MPGTAILSQGVGYGVVLGIGCFFTLLMIGLTKLQTRYTPMKMTSISEFASASHSVKPGLIACAIVSSWTWAATLLQSSAMGYKVGICGPYAYAAGATVQIFMFAVNAAKIKMNAPKAHTFLEVIRARWGTIPHVVFTFYAFATAFLVSSMLITGGSATVTDLTGMSTWAACWLIPLPVGAYTLVGGLRSSLLADFIHTFFLFVIILLFMFEVFVTNDKIGSPSKMYDLLVQAGQDWPVTGNKDGSYLTFSSKTGMVFMVINLIGNFGHSRNLKLTFPNLSCSLRCSSPSRTPATSIDWQRAIASVPSTAVKGYMLGGSAWLSIPLGMAATLGLSAVALKYDPSYPNYPIGLTPAEVSAGLPAAAAAQTLLKAGGAAALLVVLFLAVTSATAAELCATSTVMTYDIYLPYIRPTASEKELLRVDHIGIVIWCLVMAIIGWLVAAATLNDGAVNMETTFQDYPMLTGNVLSIGIASIIAFTGSLIWPENYDWVETRALHAHTEASEIVPESPVEGLDDDSKNEKGVVSPDQGRSAAPSIEGVELDTPEHLRKTHRFATIVATCMFVILMILIPVPLAASGWISTKVGFTTYVVIAFIWVFYGAFAVCIYPIWEYRKSLATIFGHIWADVTGKGKK